MTWAQECEAKIRQQAEEFQKRLYGESASADQLRQGIAAAMPQSASQVQGPVAPDTPADAKPDVVERHNAEYLRGLLQRPVATLSNTEKEWLRQAVASYGRQQ